jgi:hypothetical protein
MYTGERAGVVVACVGGGEPQGCAQATLLAASHMRSIRQRMHDAGTHALREEANPHLLLELVEEDGGGGGSRSEGGGGRCVAGAVQGREQGGGGARDMRDLQEKGLYFTQENGFYLNPEETSLHAQESSFRSPDARDNAARCVAGVAGRGEEGGRGGGGAGEQGTAVKVWPRGKRSAARVWGGVTWGAGGGEKAGRLDSESLSEYESEWLRQLRDEVAQTSMRTPI